MVSGVGRTTGGRSGIQQLVAAEGMRKADRRQDIDIDPRVYFRGVAFRDRRS